MRCVYFRYQITTQNAQRPTSLFMRALTSVFILPPEWIFQLSVCWLVSDISTADTYISCKSATSNINDNVKQWKSMWLSMARNGFHCKWPLRSTRDFCHFTQPVINRYSKWHIAMSAVCRVDAKYMTFRMRCLFYRLRVSYFLKFTQILLSIRKCSQNALTDRWLNGFGSSVQVHYFFFHYGTWCDIVVVKKENQ